MNIKALRERAGLTQKELSRKIGVSQQCIAMWETKARSPRTDKLPGLAKILSCRIDDLFSEYKSGSVVDSA